MGNPETKKDINGESLLKEKVSKALDFYLDHPEKVNFLAHRDVIDSVCGDNPTGEITEEDQKVTFELSQAILRKIKKEPRSIDQIAEMFFSTSPNLTESLSLEDSIIVSAQYSRIPELQGHIAVNMVGELVYKFTYYGGDLSGKIVEVIEKQNIPLQLDIVDFLKTIAAEAVANGSWAGQAYDVIKNTLVKLKDGSKYPIVQIAVEISLKRILKEADEPTLFFIKYRGDKTNSRLREERVTSSEKFMFPHDDQVGVIDKRLHPVRIAKDAIAYVDHSNTPVGIARREQKVISPKEYEAGFLQRVLEVVHEDEVRDVFDLVLNYTSVYKDLRNRVDVAQEIADVLGADQQTILGLINAGDYFDRQLSEIEAQKASAEISDLLQSLPDSSNVILRKYIQNISQDKLSDLELTTITSYDSLAEDPRFGVPSKGSLSTLLLSRLHKPDFLKSVSDLLGVDLREMSIRSQARLLDALSKFDQQAVARMLHILDRFEQSDRVKYLHMFITLASSPESLEDILYIGEKVDTGNSSKVFSMFAKLANSSDVTTDQFKDTAKKLDIKDVDSMSERVQKRVMSKVDRYVKDVASAIRNNIPLDIVLSQVESESSLFFSFYSQIVKFGDAKKIRELPDCILAEVDGDKVSKTDRGYMSELYRYNYEAHLKYLARELSRVEEVADTVRKKMLTALERGYATLLIEGGDCCDEIFLQKIAEKLAVTSVILIPVGEHTYMEFTQSGMGGRSVKRVYKGKPQPFIILRRGENPPLPPNYEKGYESLTYERWELVREFSPKVP